MQTQTDPSTAGTLGPSQHGRPQAVRARRVYGLRWVARRIGLGLLIVWLVSILIFLATQALPGDAAVAMLGQNATPESLAALRHQLGLDDPLVVQYANWLWNLLHGDLGQSAIGALGGGQDVAAMIGPRMVNSAILVALAAGIAIPLSLLAGAYAGARREKAFDHGVLSLTLFLTALPDFVIGLTLLVLFSTTVFQILPSIVVLGPGETPLDHPTELILPVITLALGSFAYLTRLVRGSVIDVYQSEYVSMARLKGVPEAVILRRHVLPNALVPAIQGASLVLGYLVGGVIVVEYLFNYPGLGSALNQAVASRDIQTVQAIVLIFATAKVMFNLIGDLLTVYVTPRLRTATAS
jgi:peptide/nickel transport system permease protein